MLVGWRASVRRDVGVETGGFCETAEEILALKRPTVVSDEDAIVR